MHWSKNEKEPHEATLSKRGQSLNQKHLEWQSTHPSAFASIQAAASDAFDPKTNPNGVVCFSSASNQLSNEFIARRMKEFYELWIPEETPWVFNYHTSEGGIAIRISVARLLTRWFFSNDEQVCTENYPFCVPPGEIFCGPGCSFLSNSLLRTICDPGDQILVPSPYSSSFDLQGACIGDWDCVPVPLDAEQDFCLTSEALEEAYRTARHASGRRPRALLLANPNNPIGRIAERKELEDIVNWCKEKNEKSAFHLIADESYALSAFKNAYTAPLESRPFISLGTVLEGELGMTNHILWNFGKDFGYTGLRMGALWSKNHSVHRAVAAMAPSTSVPCLTQAFLAALLREDDWVNRFVGENARRLYAVHQLVIAELDAVGIQYCRADVGGLLWCDLSPLLLPLIKNKATPTLEELWTAEAQLAQVFIQASRIALVPGAVLHASEPGWFRMCYAAAPLDSFAVGIYRFITVARNLLDIKPRKYW